MADDARANRAAKRERLAQRRKALGLSQEALAELLGVERSTVMRWERGETGPQPWIRPKLAKALQVPADRLAELLADSGDSDTKPDKSRDRTLVVPRQLPAAVVGFTGRLAELRALTQILAEAGATAPGTVVISAIGGTAGVGKTALALHWAHQVADRFPDGQLHVNLRGFDPSGTPATTAEAIRGFVDALGVPPERIPPTADAQAALYRSLLVDRQMLIVLDNARDEQQVRPLLPASPASLVIVTSRNQLTGLAAAHGARTLTVDVLPHAEAIQLLATRIGAERTAAEPEAVSEIAALCACLPLALAVAAARAAARPQFPLAVLAAEFRDSAGRLDSLDSGDPSASVQAVFSWSYRQLDAEAALMFRLLGLHPGPDISVPAAASLTATNQPEARRLLRVLTRACLIAEHAPGRFTFHDLLRTYANSQARDTDAPPSRDAAMGRIFDHYLYTAHDAALLLNEALEPITLAPARPGTVPEQPANHEEALAWFGAERHVLLAAVNRAAESGFHVHAWQLPWAMTTFYAGESTHMQEWATTERIALAAARRLGDIAGQAVSSRQLANACRSLGDHEAALGHFTDCLKLYRQLGNAYGEAKTHQGLCALAECQGRYADALDHAERALRLAHAVGHRNAEAEMLNAVGWCHGRLGEYELAREYCQRAVALVAETGDPKELANPLESLGYAEQNLGNFAEATACYERALRLSREFGEREVEATVLSRLGDIRLAADQEPQARESWQEALVIFEDMQHPDAEEVRAKLADITD